MSISELHAFHIRRVNVGFVISGPKVDPELLSTLLKIQPDSSARKGDEKRNLKGSLMGSEENCWWKIDSLTHLKLTDIRQKDINEHLDVLLEILLPHLDILNSFSEGGETFFDVLWESTYLYAETGPVIDAGYLRGVADLKAGLGFDIYQQDEED
jgi:hypothetical protein